MGTVKRALVIGVDRYNTRGLPNLTEAAGDAERIADLLRSHDDGSENWEILPILTDTGDTVVHAREVENAIIEFLNSSPDDTDEKADLLLYYAGHATRERDGVTNFFAYDGPAYNFQRLITALQQSRPWSRSITVILDCCSSGDIANLPNGDPFLPDQALLPSNVTILTASRPAEAAGEVYREGGLFSSRLIGGLEGAAADLLGNITSLSLYAHASAAFGTAEGKQRPTLKAHAVRPILVRRATPAVPIERMSEITKYFAKPTSRIVLTKHHEGVADDDGFIPRGGDRLGFTGSAKQIENDHLKAYRDAHLVRTYGGKDFWWLSEEDDPSKSWVELNELGRYYWGLAKSGLLTSGLD